MVDPAWKIWRCESSGDNQTRNQQEFWLPNNPLGDTSPLRNDIPKTYTLKNSQVQVFQLFSACFQGPRFHTFPGGTWVSRKVLGPLSKSPLSTGFGWFCLGYPMVQQYPWLPSIENRPFCCCGPIQITIWLWLTVRHGKIHHAIKFGKPSISMGHLYHGKLWMS